MLGAQEFKARGEAVGTRFTPRAALRGRKRWIPVLILVAAIGLTAPDPLRWTLLLLAGAGCISGAGMALPALTAATIVNRIRGGLRESSV